MSHPAVAGFRLSSQQERTGSQQAGVASPFWARCELIVEGPLDTAKLQDLIRGVVGRHEILRTIFCRQTGLKLPFQVILESPDFAWHSIDLTGLNEKAQWEQLANLVGARESDFDLEKGPALQVVLAKLTPEKYTLALSLPSLCADLRTMANLAAEIGHAYANGFNAVEEVTQYADVAEWQRELLASDESKSARDYWRDYCRKIDYAALDLVLAPFERKSPGEFAPAAVVKQIKVESLGLHADTSLPDFLLACWQVFLSRMTGRPNITVGCQFNGRSNSELATALGAFAKYLPLDSSCDSDLKFSAVFAQVQRDSADFRNWQDCFSWSNTEIPSSQEQGPVLPLAFEFAELPDASTFGGLRIFVGRQGVCSERFRLKLAASRQGERLELAFHFDSARLDRGTVEHWSSHFLTLLSAAAARPNTEIKRLPLLDESERQRVLIDWNQTAADYPREQCIHDLFEQQAARVPERTAVRCGEQAFTYRELSERSNQLAHYLRGQGVGPDRLVGLCLERSAETMVAVLAILKAGGAYVPLNPDNPPARLLQQLTGAAAIITESKLSAQMPEFAGPMIVLDRDQKLWATEAKSNLTSNTNPENLVYVIYTSGSTGVPKGVAVRHRNLVNYADFISKRLELEKYPEGLQFATVSTLGADLGNTCIYPALISGGTLHIVGYEMATDPRQFAEYVAKHPIDVLKIVPSHLQALVNSEDAAKLLPRKYLIFGGETLTPKLVEKIAGLNPSCEILNHYGPTETTVGSLTLKLKDYDWRKAGLASIPIGRPIQNTQVYVLDGNLEPVPVGVTGELYIAGEGVTAGYLGQAEKTSERFMKNPFADAGSEVGSTMYRTGDLARYGADGNIEFLGRGDDQVKIRGFRIELGEIETVLGRHAGVKQVVVLAREDAQGEKRLLAYVVPSREQASSGSVTGEELRSYLKQQVPDYMVPQAVVVLQKLPLNTNGKIDRQALPEPEQAQTARAYVAPRTATERAIAEIWEEVLRREPGKISVDDNFFDLGGHSLLATQVISRVRRALNVELPLRTLFESPTIAALAGQAEKTGVAGQPEVPPIVRVPRETPLPLSFAQQRLWVLDQIEPNNPLYNIPRSTRLKGKLNTQALIGSLNEVVRRHESQRTTFVRGEDGQPVQVIAESLTLNVPVMDVSDQPEGERENEALRIACEEEQTPFDLSKGPLLRAKLLRLGPEDHVLLLTMHHIVSDAWSAAIFLQEMSTLYSAFIAGNPSPLPELAVQYGDYAAWQRKLLQGAVLDSQLNYWREQLRGAPPLLELPADRPRPSVRKFEGAYEPIPLAKDVVDAMKAFSQAEGATPFMTLLAAFNALLTRYSGQEHIVLGTDIANRTTAETERMIGFFINLLPIHTDLSGDPSFRELVSRVREVALGAYAHQDVPFDKLVEDLQPERSRSHNPIVQALFVMQNVPRRQRELPGLELSPFPVPLSRSKFDLALFMSDNGTEVGQHWVYSTELFDRSTILHMASHFENLLGQAVSQPDARLSALEMRSREEIRQLEKEKSERKQSQRKKLAAVEPKAVRLGSTPGKEER